MKHRILLLCMTICFLLSGCVEVKEEKEQIEQQKRFYTDYHDNVKGLDGVIIMMDKETKVQYLIVDGYYGVGVCALVDAEGNPLLYEEGEPND